MRVACLIVSLVCGASLFAKGMESQDKDTTLKGNILCARCALKEGDKCQTAIQVKESGKDITYYFNDKGNQEEYHEDVCGGKGKQGTVLGKVADKEGKKWITPTKVTYDKK